MKLPNPEAIAQGVVDKAMLKNPPIDLEGVVALWPELTLSYDDLDGSGYLLDLGALGAEIMVNANDKQVRTRYTIAHELGHWVLNKALDETSTSHAEVERTCIEKWCDQFAAALLMPRDHVFRYFQNVKWFEFVNAILAGPNYFHVSNLAFRARVVELLPTAIIELEQNENGFDVVKAFPQSKHLESSTTSLIDETIQDLKPVLDKHPEHEWFDDPRTNFRTVQKLLISERLRRLWLVSIHPASSSIFSSADVTWNTENQWLNAS